MMRQTTYTYGDATITIHAQTIGDQLDMKYLMAMLPDDVKNTRSAAFKLSHFLMFVLSIDQVYGNLGILLPQRNAPDDEIAAAFEAFVNAPPALLETWSKHWERLNAGGNDPDLSPASDPKNE